MNSSTFCDRLDIETVSITDIQAVRTHQPGFHSRFFAEMQLLRCRAITPSYRLYEFCGFLRRQLIEYRPRKQSGIFTKPFRVISCLITSRTTAGRFYFFTQPCPGRAKLLLSL